MADGQKLEKKKKHNPQRPLDSVCEINYNKIEKEIKMQLSASLHLISRTRPVHIVKLSSRDTDLDPFPKFHKARLYIIKIEHSSQSSF